MKKLIILLIFNLHGCTFHGGNIITSGRITPFTHTYYMEHAPIYRLDSNPLECKYYNSSTIKWQFANSNNYLIINCNGSSSLGVFRSWLVACCSETTNINPIILVVLLPLSNSIVSLIIFRTVFHFTKSLSVLTKSQNPTISLYLVKWNIYVEMC